MNILIPHTWLLEHLDTDAKPADIQRCLSLSGPSIERIYDKEGEPVYDIEVTTNRVDSASVRGIATEAAAILPEFGFKAKLKPLTQIDLNTSSKNLDIKIENDPKLCHRIITVKLSNLKLKPSPAWLQKRLRQIDLRPINNLIDITNYVMWDLGHPIHAFDYDRLITKKIIVRTAKKGEKFITLDDVTHTCKGGEVVFDDGKGTIIDLPGIMGTANTAVSDTTKNVLLWIETIDAVKIRRASMGLSIRTQAAVLNEKSVDPNLAPIALSRAIDLYQQVAKATVASKITDIYPHSNPIISTTLSLNQIDTYLGIHLKPEKVIKILETLGCIVKTKHSFIMITPPSTRSNDLQIPEDYIEEVARIYGYHNLPSIIMPTAIPDNPTIENFSLEHQIKLWLADFGAQEVYTYSMVSAALAKQSGFSLSDHLKIANPLSDDWVYLRRSLIPSLVEVIATNPPQNRLLFEMQNLYHPQKNNLPTEELHLTLISNQSYASIKGVFDALIKRLYVTDYYINSKGDVHLNRQSVGTAKQIDTNIFVIDIDVAKLLAHAHTHPLSLSINPYPPIIEDLTFTFPQKTHVGPVIATIACINPQIASVTLKTTYNQNHTFTITYQSPDKNLSTKDIAPIRKKIVTTLESQKITLVGKI